MPLPNSINQIYIPASAEEIRDAWLTDYRLMLIAAGVSNPAVQPGSEAYIRATATANCILGLFANIEISAEDTSELTATGTALDAIREALGLVDVGAAPAGGNVTVGVVGASPVLFADGTEFVLPNGLRGAVSGSQVKSNGESVAVLMVDTGEASNAVAGTKIRWVSPPLNVLAEAEVGIDGLTGGTDPEGDDRKRERILNRRRYLPAGGNWAHLVELAEGSTGSVQKAFVYPALGGPGSAKVVVTKAANLDSATWDLSRELGATSIAQHVEPAIFGEAPQPSEIVVQSAQELNTGVALSLTLPAQNSPGGKSIGWVNSAPFPALVVGDGGNVTITNITADKKTVTIDAQTTTAPVANETKISWWCSDTGKVVTSNVVTSSGSSGAWVLVLTDPLVSGAFGAAVGDYISPAAHNLQAYADSWCSEMNKLGPGENTADQSRLPRARRHPYSETGWSAELTAKQITNLMNAHSEISDAEYALITPSSVTVPGSIDQAPYVRRLTHFAIYKK